MDRLHRSNREQRNLGCTATHHLHLGRLSLADRRKRLHWDLAAAVAHPRRRADSLAASRTGTPSGSAVGQVAVAVGASVVVAVVVLVAGRGAGSARSGLEEPAAFAAVGRGPVAAVAG